MANKNNEFYEVPKETDLEQAERIIAETTAYLEENSGMTLEHIKEILKNIKHWERHRKKALEENK